MRLKKSLALLLTLVMLLGMLPVSALADAPAVAQANGTGYATLEEAIAAISTVATSTHSNSTAENKVYNTYTANGTVKLLADCEGDGLIIGENSNLTIDFDGHTYSITGRPVGSNGTETIGFQLLKGSDITFENGCITGNSRTNTALQRLIQNYSNLTLDNMTLSLVGLYYNQSTMSNCNGAIQIKDSTINAPDFTWAGRDSSAAGSELGAIAFSVGTFSSYPEVSVEITGNSTINGYVSVDPENTGISSLDVKNGTINGDISVKPKEAGSTTSLNISGGTVNGAISTDGAGTPTITITGGTFSSDVSEYVTEDGKASVENADANGS